MTYPAINPGMDPALYPSSFEERAHAPLTPAPGFFGTQPAAAPALSRPAIETPSWWTRAWGLAKTAGGALETAAGIAGGIASSWSGIGAAAGGAVTLHGADTTISGVRQMYSGQRTESLTSQGIAALTGSEAAGELADAGLGIAGTAGVGLATRIAASEPLAAKTVQWTDQLLPGEGMTGPYGDMLLSRLGSALDRAQVYIHEKVHSILSPAADGIFSGIRADLRSFLYSESQLMRYGEEALAETVAQVETRGDSGLSLADAVQKGLEFPIANGYVTIPGLAAEAAGAAGKVIDLGFETERAADMMCSAPDASDISYDVQNEAYDSLGEAAPSETL